MWSVISSHADGPRDDDAAMTSVGHSMLPTVTVDDTPPTIAWSGCNHGGGMLPGVETL